MRLPFILLTSVILLMTGCDFFQNCHTNSWISYSPIYTSWETYPSLIKSIDTAAVENIGKVYHYENYTFVNEKDKGQHVYEKDSGGTLIYKAFISIPGNNDIQIIDDALLADSYSLMLSIDITDIQNVIVTKIIKKALPIVYIHGSTMTDSDKGVVTDWKEEKHESEYCSDGMYGIEEASDVGVAGGGSEVQGTAGSLSRMVLYSNYMYVVSDGHLTVLELRDPAQPNIWSRLSIDWGLETLFRQDSMLYIGSSTGMHIYSLAVPENPEYVSQFDHVTSCDPVVVEGNYAYVTLRSGSGCRRGSNELILIDLFNKKEPTEMSTFSMYNPHGLAVRDDTLFVCDGSAGIKIFDVSDKDKLEVIHSIPNIDARDIILNGNEATILAYEGVYLFDISDIMNPIQKSFNPAVPKEEVEMHPMWMRDE